LAAWRSGGGTLKLGRVTNGWRLGVRAGNAKARTGDKLANSRKTFREHTPRMTPNRLLGGVFII